MTFGRPAAGIYAAYSTEGITVRRGTTLIETLVVLAIIGIASGIAWPRVLALADRAASRAAVTAVIAALAAARHAAIAQGRVVAVHVDSTRAEVVVAADRDTLVAYPLRSEHGVEASATRDSIAFAPNGRGYGAANTTIVLTRGASADTILVSRLGRWRRARN
ncbi:MAG: GspH/FimT family pseudopilin [Gemmatimonadaceae bacterium]